MQSMSTRTTLRAWLENTDRVKDILRDQSLIKGGGGYKMADPKLFAPPYLQYG